MSLRLRINLVITLVTVAFTAAMFHVILNDMRSSVREEIESTTRVAVQLVEAVVSGVYLEPGPGERTDVLLALLKRVGRVRANDIRFYDASGKLLYQSPASTYRSGAGAPEWFSALVRPQVPEARLSLPGGAIVVTPDASRSILEAWDDLKGLALLALAFLVLVNAAVFWLLARALRPLPRILDGLGQLARGQFHVRLPAFRAREFGAISEGFNHMAHTLEASLAENRQLALVARQSSDAIIIRDLAGCVTYCNAAAERLLGYAQHELVGAPASLIAPPERHEELRAQLASIAQRAPVELVESKRVAKDGRVLDVALSAAPLVDPASDRVIGEICSLRDITEYKRMQAAELELEQNRALTALIQSRLEAERRALARELHDELAQCVTAIKTIGTAVAARAGEANPDIRDNANTIVSVASHIYDIVHGLIRRLRPSGLDHLGLAETLRDAVSGWSKRYPQVRWELALSGELDGLGEALNITIYRIVQEALTNVVRHAEARCARICVERGRAGRLEDAVVICVRDDGKGLPQAGAERSGRFGVAGMRERVQSFGGSLAISGAPGEGVELRAVLPVAGAERATLADIRA